MNTHQNKLELFVPAILCVMVLCTGCPYESKFPLDGTKVKYDKNLLGNWHQDQTDLKIMRVDDYRFNYVYDDHDEDNGAGEETGTGYAITNNGSTYIVAERDQGGDKTFAIYKILDIESETLVVIPLDEDNITASKQFKSAQDFTSYVINNNSSAFTYSDRAEFEKGVSSFAGYKTKANNYNTKSQSYSTYNTPGNILFKEDFQTADNKWYTNYDFKDSNYIYINTLDNPDNHFYLFRNRKKSGGNFIVPIPYNYIPNANYSIEIAAKHFDGEVQYGYGIRFAASDWDNCYSLNITDNGYYRLLKWDNGQYKTILDWTKSSALYQGSNSNKVKVSVYYDYLDLYINDQYITRVTGFSRFGNYAGLEVYNDQTIYFDDLVIRKL